MFLYHWYISHSDVILWTLILLSLVLSIKITSHVYVIINNIYKSTFLNIRAAAVGISAGMGLGLTTDARLQSRLLAS